MASHEKRVFILGAGSSIGHSHNQFPNIKEFFVKAKNIGLDLERDYSQINEYTISLYDRSILDRRNRIDIESLFTNVEIEIERRPSHNLIQIRQQLLRLIQLVLIGLEQKIDSKRSEYNDLFDQLHSNDTIITFNWDLLFDDVLWREKALEVAPTLSGCPKPQYTNFLTELSIYHDFHQAHGIDRPYTLWPADTGQYLKMHGSVDWFYCANESCYGHNKVFPLLNPTADHYCSECHEQVQLLIIPPILNKGYRNYPLIRRIWNLAAQEIRSATELIIWGYSLPPTDFYSDWLMRQARNAPLSKLSIINPEAIDKSKTKIGPIVGRFRDMFRKKSTHPEVIIYEYFSDYPHNDSRNKYRIGWPLMATNLRVT